MLGIKYARSTKKMMTIKKKNLEGKKVKETIKKCKEINF
jgi:hypothetical protein